MSMQKGTEKPQGLLSPGFRQEAQRWSSSRTAVWLMCWLDKLQGAILSPHDNSNLLFEIIFFFFSGLLVCLSPETDSETEFECKLFIWRPSQNSQVGAVMRWDRKGNEPVKSDFSGQGSQSHADCGAWYLANSLLLPPGWGLLPDASVLRLVRFALLEAWIKAFSRCCSFWQHSLPAQGDIQGVYGHECPLERVKI